MLDNKIYKAFDAAVATGVSETFRVDQAKYLGITVVGATVAAAQGIFTIKVRGSRSDVAPLDFTSTPDLTHPYDEIGIFDEQTGAFIPGATGIIFGASGVKNFKINCDPSMHHIAFVITGYTSGSATVHFSVVQERNY